MLILAVLLLNFGCSSTYENVETFKYEIPPLYISEKDCQGGACVEIRNYDINCEEFSFSYGYNYCLINIYFRYEEPEYRYDDIYDILRSSESNVVCKASIEAFDNYLNTYTPKRLSNKDNTYVYYSGNDNTDHYFNFDFTSEVFRVYVTGIECGIDEIPPRPLTEAQKAEMDIWLRPICLREDYVVKSPWDYCIKYIEEQKAEME